MKTRKLVWFVSLAVAGLVSLTAQHLSTAGSKPELRTDGGAPVPPPPPRPSSPAVSGINA
jgi:hypothetical protein